MTRMIVTSATRLLHQGLNLRFVARREDSLDWTCDHTQRSFTFTDAEIANLIAQGKALFQPIGSAPFPDPVVDPQDVDDEALAAALRRLAYAEDVIAAGLAHRADAETFTAVVKATAARRGEANAPSSRSVKRWVAKALDNPSAYGLLDLHSRKGNRTLRISDEEHAVIDRMIDKYHLRPTRPSIEQLVAFIRDEFNILNDDLPADSQLKIPGRRAVEGVLAERDPMDVDRARYGPAYANQKHGSVTRQADPEAPLDKVELDHTRADIFLISEEDGLPLGRPTIGFAIDRCTRMPLGLYVGFEEPSVLTLMQILKHAMFPKTYVDAKVATGEWDLLHSWHAWGTPRTLMLDRAMENLGHDLRLSARELGIRDLAFAATKQGRQKGAVERHFRTLNKRLLHEQRGTTFSNVVERDDYDSQKNAVLTLSELQRHLHRYFVDIYPHSRHKGLRGDLPARVWKERIDRWPSAPPRPLEELVHLFTRHVRRQLRRDGILLFNMEYASSELDQVRLSPDFAKAARDRNVLVRYDPADISQLWIQVPHTGRYLKVPVARRWAEYAAGKSEWEHKQVLEHHRIRSDAAFDPDALAHSRRAIVDETDAAAAKLASRRRFRARLDGIGRTSPAADDPSTSPILSEASKRDNRRKHKPANDTSARGGDHRPELAPVRVARRMPGVIDISFEDDE